MALFYLWYLVAMPYDRHVCDLWVSRPPDNPAIVQACGLQVAANLSAYEFRAIDLREEIEYVSCSAPADTLLDLPCDLYPLDAYRLEIWQADVSNEMLCSVELEREGYPGRLEIFEQCERPEALEKYDAGHAKWDYIGQFERTEPDPAPVCRYPAPSTGTALSQTPANVADLGTDTPYALLAGRLIWYGYVKPDCDGLSGLDPVTLAPTGCGMSAARGKVREWQNQFDGSIYGAALDASVPAVMLKAIIGLESQFWPLWESSTAGETGAAQITADGLDVPLRYDAALFEYACPLAIFPVRCERGYHGLAEWEQEAVRLALRNTLGCKNCSVQQAIQKTEADAALYARFLRAWRCYTGQIAPGSADPWRVAAAAYHAGGSCITGAGICPAGENYLRRLE